MKIFCPVWGKKHIDLLYNALGYSLKWPCNAEEVKGAEWIITTDSDKSLSLIREAVGMIDPTASVYGIIKPGLVYPAAPAGTILMEALKETIVKCLSDNVPMLMATPDFIYGDGSIRAFKASATDRGSCVTIAHMRVLPEIITEIHRHENSWETEMFNDDLVNAGFKYPHITWEASGRESSPGISYAGGIQWHWVRDRVAAVQHYLPSPFFVNFLKEDLDFFSSAKPSHFLLWDHAWPAKLLESGRLRYIGSSEAALMLEVTEANANVPPNNPPGITNNDSSVKNGFHNIIQKQFLYIMRGA